MQTFLGNPHPFFGDFSKFLAKNDIGESCVATPAIAENRIYVRTINTLYCFANKSAEQKNRK